ncbi:hypothetical protein ACLMJK_006408 [Lecanora helva]
MSKSNNHIIYIAVGVTILTGIIFYIWLEWRRRRWMRQTSTIPLPTPSLAPSSLPQTPRQSSPARPDEFLFLHSPIRPRDSLYYHQRASHRPRSGDVENQLAQPNQTHETIGAALTRAKKKKWMRGIGLPMGARLWAFRSKLPTAERQGGQSGGAEAIEMANIGSTNSATGPTSATQPVDVDAITSAPSAHTWAHPLPELARAEVKKERK